MSGAVKRWDTDTETWIKTFAGPPGDDGAQGPEGPEGPPGGAGLVISETPPGNTDVLWFDTTAEIPEMEEFQGPAGPQGEPGPAGPSGADGSDGTEAEFRVENDVLEWRYVGESTWNTLTDFSTLSVDPAVGGYYLWDLDGDMDAARPTEPPDSHFIAFNSPATPTNLTSFDLYIGPDFQDNLIVSNLSNDSYVLELNDIGKAVEINSSTANTVTVQDDGTVAWPVGAVIEVAQVGTGQTTIEPASGVDIRLAEGFTASLRGQWSVASLRKRAANEWILAGDLEVT